MARHGENIYLRKDGRWEGRYVKGRKPDSKSIYGSVYARKYCECKEKLGFAKALYINHGRVVKADSKETLSKFMTYWLYNIVRQNVKDSTFGTVLNGKLIYL